MIKLKSLISEISNDYPEDSNLWDDWEDYLDHFDYDIEKSEISKLIQKNDLEYETYFDNKILMLSQNKTIVYLTHDIEAQTFDVIKDINDWIYNSAEQFLEIDSSNIYSGYIETTLKEMSQHPGSVYHYTTEEKFNLIKQTGKMNGSYGTGINNRSSYGIFTSVNPEEYQDGVYGDICLMIDLENFKKDNNLKELSLEYEPEVSDYMIREYVASVLEIEFRDSLPSDMSPYTIIVRHTIPSQYIKQI